MKPTECEVGWVVHKCAEDIEVGHSVALLST